MLNHVRELSDGNGRNANRVILYEDASRKLLKEFLSALRGCELMAQTCSSLSTILDNTESELLHQLLTPGKRLPDICSTLKHFKDAFDWSEADCSGRIVPHEGVDEEYDSACDAVKDIKLGLSKHLKDQHKILGDKSIKYVTVGKDEYLLEVPETLQAKIPRDYELQSSKKGYFRYWTPKIKKYLAELSQAEDEKESKLKSILQRLIGHFCEHHTKWRQLVSATAELDVLSSLAVASDYYEGSTCRPTIIDISCSSEARPFLAAKNLGHPVLKTESLGKCSFVPNDVNIGGAGRPSFILLTGPNMGGKSTLLRQICLAVILAQIGADVPAECFELSPVDQIFVRMGARDHIMAGQSTFLTELSETATMLLSATNNSLVALDELGRGTSTSDGQAIAFSCSFILSRESVLQHFVSKIRCRGIFSTHYHRLAVDYEKDPEVSLCHMACQVGKGLEGVEEVTFLYKLTPGACPKSYGVNVARLAGLPESVLLKASAKSSEFEAAYGRNGQQSKHERPLSEDAPMVIQDVLHAVIASDYSESTSMELLSNMQQKALMICHLVSDPTRAF
ncbi:DNA mismatch repair protein msh6 [Asimina triloba]